MVTAVIYLDTSDPEGFGDALGTTGHLFEDVEGFHGFDLLRGIEDFLSDFPVDEFPHMAEHVRQHLKPHEGDMTGFEFALNLFVDGLDRARDSD
jgi:hypothetical protein